MAQTFDYVLKASIEDEEKRLIKGYATVDVIDRDDEIIDVQSVAKSFEKYMGRNPVVLRDHDLKKAIGKTLQYTADAKKVEVLVEIAKNAQDADETWELIKQGVLRSFSIRGRPAKVQYVKKNGKRVRKIAVNDILELSVVSVPANQESLFQIVSKSVGDEMEEVVKTIQEMKNELKEEVLKEIKIELQGTREELVKVVKEIAKAKKEVPDGTEKQSSEENSNALLKQVEETVKKTIAESKELLAIQKALAGVPNTGENNESEKWTLEKFAAKYWNGGKK